MNSMLSQHTPNGYSPATSEFLADALAGLTDEPKRLPCKYFYDKRGSELFEKICELPEYYPTRIELSIMQEHSGEMADRIGPEAELIELGSGNSLKTRLLLKRLTHPAAYVPVDISERHLKESAKRLAAEFPHIPILPVCADFSRDFDVPMPPRQVSRKCVYFPGSTIGNFTPEGVHTLLNRIANLVSNGGGLLIGLDLKKSIDILEAAYNDQAGVTAEFNLNLLRRLQNELDADLNPDQFEHSAFYNRDEGRIEMHLTSKTEQTIELDGVEIGLKKGETIHTENSYKYGLDEFGALAGQAGFERKAVWTDDSDLFSVQFFEVR
jgi:dimethylhistidine N-methyltransferase